MKVALITGITGQDGSYLAEILLQKEYDVWGIIRRSSDINTHRINHLYSNQKLILKYGDLTDSSNLLHILEQIRQKYNSDLEQLEIYNLGAMSHVKVSFEIDSSSHNNLSNILSLVISKLTNQAVFPCFTKLRAMLIARVVLPDPGRPAIITSSGRMLHIISSSSLIPVGSSGFVSLSLSNLATVLQIFLAWFNFIIDSQ